jgi:hypothetical protein
MAKARKGCRDRTNNPARSRTVCAPSIAPNDVTACRSAVTVPSPLAAPSRRQQPSGAILAPIQRTSRREALWTQTEGQMGTSDAGLRSTKVPWDTEGSERGDRRSVPAPSANLKQRRDALKLECAYQIDVLMLLTNLADHLDGESQRAAIRSLSIRTRDLTTILLSLLHGEDKGLGEWELRVFGFLQGNPTAPVSVAPQVADTTFEPI